MVRKLISDLYVVPPQFDKLAGTKMPPDPELWAETIFGVFSEQYPELAEMSGGDIEWDQNRLDGESGFGVGTIIVNSNNNIVKIPVVVKEFHLQPIDIFEADDKMKLLNDENIGAALKQQDSIGEVSYPDRSKFISADFTYWLSKNASSDWNIKVDKFTKFAQRIGGPYIDDLLQKLSDIQPLAETGTTVYLQRSNDKIGNIDATYYKNGEVTQMTKLEPVLMEDGDLKEASKEAFNKGSAILMLDEIEPSKVGFIGVDATTDLKLITEPGIYEVEQIKAGGVEGTRVFVMNIIPLGQRKVSENARKAYVVEGDNGLNYAMQESVTGKPIEAQNFDFSDSIVPLKDADRYERGYLLYNGSNNVENCSELIRINRMESTPRGQIRMFLKTQEGDVHYLINDDFKVVQPLSDSNPLRSETAARNYTGPNLLFLKVNEIVELVSSLDKYQMIYEHMVEKAADDGEYMVVRSAGGGCLSTTLLSNHYEDDPEHFMARMLSLGMTPDKIASLISHINGNGRDPVTVVGIKLAESMPKIDGPEKIKLVSLVNGLRVELIKAAAAIAADDGEQGVITAILGLGLVDEENIRYFVQLSPVLEDVVNVLAKMLYSTRVGGIDISEGAIKSALINITKIIGSLKEISSGIS